MSTDNKYDENIVSQLMVFGYSKNKIIQASNAVVDYKDINVVQAKLDADIDADPKPTNDVKNKKSKKSKKNKKNKLRFSLPAPNNMPMIKSKSANIPKTKKLKKKAGNSWIKSNQTKQDAWPPVAFSRQTSILKLRQIATVSKRRKKPKKKTLVDIIYESDEEDEYQTNTDENAAEDEDSLMLPMLDRRFGLSADSGMNQLLNKKNKELQDNYAQNELNDSSWMTQKKKKKVNHVQAELSLMFDFRDFEKNNPTKEYEKNIENMQSDKAIKAMELMKQKTFNAVKLQQDIKQKAIQGFTERLEKQKKLIESGFTASPLINDEDFVVDENADSKQQNGDMETKKMNKRDMLKQALKNEDSALEHCVLIVEELGFLKYMKDDETYMQLMKSKQNVLSRELNVKKNKNGKFSAKNDTFLATFDENEEADFDHGAMGRVPPLNVAQIALEELKTEMKETDEEEYDHDLFCMSNSNLLLSLKQTNCQLLMRMISRSLVMIQSLKFIELCNCGVDDYFMSQIFLQLLENISQVKVNTLSLQSNCIGDDGILCLCEYMKANNEHLKVVKLQNNRRDISTDVCQQICEALEVNNYVIKFDFEFRHYGERDRSYQALKRNSDSARIQRVGKMKQMVNDT